jgi:uncharacterized membrane protein
MTISLAIKGISTTASIIYELFCSLRDMMNKLKNSRFAPTRRAIHRLFSSRLVQRPPFKEKYENFINGQFVPPRE